MIEKYNSYAIWLGVWISILMAVGVLVFDKKDMSYVWGTGFVLLLV